MGRRCLARGVRVFQLFERSFGRMSKHKTKIEGHWKTREAWAEIFRYSWCAVKRDSGENHRQCSPGRLDADALSLSTCFYAFSDELSPFCLAKRCAQNPGDRAVDAIMPRRSKLVDTAKMNDNGQRPFPAASDVLLPDKPGVCNKSMAEPSAVNARTHQRFAIIGQL